MIYGSLVTDFYHLYAPVDNVTPKLPRSLNELVHEVVQYSETTV